ncbi:sterol desaturase family protein [Candidatus Spongiihabitans sp.]|uniref:sterol desaturase family protein n=1 Tax=Candidatus Spongiihabitans sp. TaxID=3101308 RepID=UPI003C705827
MNAIDAQFAAFADTFEALELIGLIFLLAIVSETLWDIFTGQRKKLGETFANFAIALGNHFLERTLYGLVFILGLFLIAPFAPFSIPITWWSWILALIAADLTYYWMHRWEHEIRILWAYHSVHHSSSEFNLTTGLRLAWVEGLIEWVFFVPMILLGVDVVQTIIALVIVVAYQTWIHTEKIGKLGWADRIFNTPSVHRVHHGSNKKYIDRNYGGILIVWDRLFGTYQAEEEKVVYGLAYRLGTSNPIMINLHEYWQIIKDARRSRNIHELFGYVFRPPGWKPKNHLQNV